jgi:hypothetical protein
MVLQALSRRTEAFSASLDFSAARVAWARPSWKNPSTTLNARRPAMIDASTSLLERQLEHDRSFQHPWNRRPEFGESLRRGCSAVSGIVFGPN